jgi:hypothetical protein
MVHTRKQKQQRIDQDIIRFMERSEQQMKRSEQQMKEMAEVLSALHLKCVQLSTSVQRLESESSNGRANGGAPTPPPPPREPNSQLRYRTQP